MRDAPKQLHYYRLSPDEVLKDLHTSAAGLSTKDARERFLRYGANTLRRTKHVPAPLIFLRQFKNLLVIMLLASTGFSMYLNDYKTAAILLAIALMNACVGYAQEHKAGTLMESLERLLVQQAKVLRGGRTEEIDSSELVPGDVIYIEAGDSVPADARILEESELATNDFALTGESNPSRKFVHAIGGEVPLGARHNLLFMGTTVATGCGHAVVIGTGMRSELGRIASLSQTTRVEASPLQKEMNHLATRLAQGTIVLAGLLTAIALKAHLDLHDAVLFGISIGAAMIPNGLVAEVNITLAQAAGRLAKSKALVKKLSAVETLGATNFILTDKTGTLTKNEMTVEQILIGRDLYAVSGTGYEANGNIMHKGRRVSADKLQDLELFFTTATLASNAKVDPPDEEHATWYVVGDPTEGALITLARKAGVEPDQLEADMPELKEFQFDSARKLLSSVRRRGDQVVVFTKGAPESVLARSNEIWDHGHVRKLTAADRTYFADYNEKQARAAKRNLAFGFRILPASAASHKKFIMAEVEQDFTFLGLASMVDPLREAVPAAMKSARAARVSVSIVTGDFPTTAKAIAEQAGLSDEITVIMGTELTHLSDNQILQLVARGGAVFSRVAPEDKLRIVELARQSGHVVAVTGDGINDAPALKRADIGVAMGKTGTDVAKDAADIVLLDDSFDTLVGAIKEGRLTFKNIRKAARCALTDNAGELITVLIGLGALSLLHVAPAITAIQILAIDVVAQILPITALGWDKARPGLMREKPRNLRDHIINKRAVSGFVGYGALAAALAYGNYLLFFARHALSPRYLPANAAVYHHATTLTYLTLVLCLYIYLLFERSDTHARFFTSYLWSNTRLLQAFAASFFLIGNVVYNPWIQPYFGTAALSFADWLTALAAAGIYMAVRLSQRHTRKHSRRKVAELHQKVHGPTTAFQYLHKALVR